MSNEVKRSLHIKRHIVAAFVLPVLFAYIYFLPPLPYFLALLMVVGMMAMWEFYVMYKVQSRLYIPGVFIGGILFYLFCRHPEYFMNGIFIGLFLLLILRLVFVMPPSGCMSEVGPLGIGFFYISGFLSFQWLLRTEMLGLEYIFLLYISVWLADSMAYYFGTYIGKKKLYPAISPNKTFEGAFGSILGGIVGAVMIKIVFGIPGLTTMGTIAIGATLGVTAVVGDLIESMFKRDAGVKDSSSFIPGHGGVLDKLDGLLVSGPVLYLIVRHF